MSDELSHLTVIEIASVLAGPFTGMFFAERGAKVIKIENKKTGGDVTRSWKLATENPDSPISAYFASVNWGKEHVFLDFESEADVAKLRAFISKADVVIVNFKKGDDKKFGLCFEDVKNQNGRIIYAALSGFGTESDRVAYDLVLQAEAGLMSMNGTPESGPLKMPVAFVDLFAGHQLREGILLALLQREKNPGAYRVDVSLFDAALASLANQACNWLMAGQLAQPNGGRHPNIAPYGETFKTREGRTVTFAIGTNIHFSKLCKTIDLLSFPADERFRDNADRVKNRGELETAIAEKISKLHCEALLRTLMNLGVPVAEVKNLSQVFEAQAARDLVLEESVDFTQTRRMRTSVFKVQRFE